MSHEYVAIDDVVAAKVKAMHRKYPRLGHHGIVSALNDEGIHVHPEELERFMTKNRMKAEKPWKPWKWLGAPTWMGGFADYPRKLIRWRPW